MDVYGPPTISAALFEAVLRAAKSPVLSERPAREYYDLCVRYGLDPAFALAVAKQEHTYGTNPQAVVVRYGIRNWADCRTRRKSSLGGQSIATDRGNFWAYQSWYDSLDDLCYRLTDPTYAYAGKRTVEQIIPIMAPPGDHDNDPAAYVRAVLAQITAWRAQEAASAAGGDKAMGHVPKPPITDHIIGIPPKVDGVGVDVAGTRRTPGASVLHSMAGTLGSCDNYFPGATVEALTDFGIGQTNFNGSGFAQIIQWCDIYGFFRPWASGPVRVPQGDGPRFLAHFGGAQAVNDVGVSIEHDDTTNPDGSRGPVAAAPVSVYQWSASLWLQAWLHAEVFGQTAATYDWNMHHREFCGDAYKRCPMPRITDHTEEYQAAVKAIMDHFQAGVPYPAGGLIVAGLRINTPPEGAAGKVPIAPVVQEGIVASYVDKPGQGVYWGTDEHDEPFLVIKPGGKMKPGTVNVALEDVGLSGIGMDDAQYSISIQHGAWGQYNRTTPGK